MQAQPLLRNRTAMKEEAAPFERVQTTRAFEEVAAQIRQRVIHGHLKAGDRLPAERDLAVRLGVSRNTRRCVGWKCPA